MLEHRIESPEKGAVGTPDTGFVVSVSVSVSVTVSVSDPVRSPGSGVRNPGSGCCNATK